jgi:hypothetical protein
MKKPLLTILYVLSALLSFGQTQESIQSWDGPYVLYSGKVISIQTIFKEGDHLRLQKDSVDLGMKKQIRLNVATDLPDVFFEVNLKSSITPEPAETRKASKQFILSDIEGNFGAFRKLLLAGGVIDSAFHWAFGNGHLVLNGDFFDRNSQVTEVLWLIYSLEDQAKAAGGYVHFILGNHEIMNLSHDFRYHATKYAGTEKNLGISFDSLYGRSSELGRWLRSKNIIEKVGNHLIMHGGFSTDMNYLGMDLTEINNLSRPYYDDTTFNYSDPRLNFVFGETGPMWYRGYYMTQPLATQQQIDSTLDKYLVTKIITGHSIMGETISSWFDGHVLNTDVEHIRGHSEAILADGKNYYRVKPNGERVVISL